VCDIESDCINEKVRVCVIYSERERERERESECMGVWLRVRESVCACEIVSEREKKNKEEWKFCNKALKKFIFLNDVCTFRET